MALQKQMAAKFKSILGKSLKEMGVFGWAFVGAGLDTLSKLLGVSEYGDISKIVEDADKAIKNKQYEQYEDLVQNTKKDFEKLTKQVKDQTTKFLVVFLDDLDRCLPDNALRVLESLKNLFVVKGAQVVFLCGIDTGVAKQFIRSRYQRMESDFAVNYFKKIFNHTIELPCVPPENLKQRLVSYLEELFNGDQLENVADYTLRLSNLAGNRSLRSIFNVVNQYYVIQQVVDYPVNGDKVLPILFLKEKWHGFYEQVVVEARKSAEPHTELRTILSSDELQDLAEPYLRAYLKNDEAKPITTIAELNELNLL